MNVAPVYDAGALIAAERADRVMWARHAVVIGRGYRPVVPATVAAQVIRSPRQHGLHRLLTRVDIRSLDAVHANAVGHLLAAAGRSDIVDAHVVHLAVAERRPVFTSDRRDLEHLAAANGAQLDIVDV